MNYYTRRFTIAPDRDGNIEMPDVMKTRVFLSEMPDKVMHACAEGFGVTSEEIKSRCRKAHIADARHCYVYMMRALTPLSLVAIGKTIGRDHSTCLNSIKRFMGYIENYEAYALAYQESLSILERTLNLRRREIENLYYNEV